MANVLSTEKRSRIVAAFPSEGEVSDFFGRNVAVDGKVVLVGADGDDDLGDGAGSAYVFEGLPLLVVRGTCPGSAEVELIGATGDGTVGLVRGTEPGSFLLGGACRRSTSRPASRPTWFRCPEI